MVSGEEEEEEEGVGTRMVVGALTILVMMVTPGKRRNVSY